MYLTHRPPTPQEPARPTVAARTVRKIALCGSHDGSLKDAPWTDPSWEFWGHASSHAWYRRPMDRYFDLHPAACRDPGRKGKALYSKWLAGNTVPIYMQRRDPAVPASIEYPKGRILMEFGDARPYFTNHAAWMIALAMTEGVSAIGLFGINYSTESEYARQRGSCEYWLGRAAQAGVRIVLPSQCSLLADPVLLYGYESHDEQTGLLKDAYKRKEWKPQETIRPVAAGEKVKRAEPPDYIKAQIEAEEREHPRPEWALGPMPDGEVPLMVPADGRTVQSGGFSARLVACQNGTQVPRGDGMAHWVGSPVATLPHNGNEGA